MEHFEPKYLNQLFRYKNGFIFWKKHRHPKCIGKRAGWVENTDGYRIVGIDKGRYKEHRIIFIMLKGKIPNSYQIDHRNGIKDDNRLRNLRMATESQNKMNIGIRKDNKSGFKGVHFSNYFKKWIARIRKDGKSTHLGYFKSAALAGDAYRNAAKKIHGKYANC